MVRFLWRMIKSIEPLKKGKKVTRLKQVTLKKVATKKPDLLLQRKNSQWDFEWNSQKLLCLHK